MLRSLGWLLERALDSREHCSLKDCLTVPNPTLPTGRHCDCSSLPWYMEGEGWGLCGIRERKHSSPSVTGEGWETINAKPECLCCSKWHQTLWFHIKEGAWGRVRLDTSGQTGPWKRMVWDICTLDLKGACVHQSRSRSNNRWALMVRVCLESTDLGIYPYLFFLGEWVKTKLTDFSFT